MHLFHYTPEIPNFLNKCNFEGEKQYLILFNLQKILQKYSKLCSDKIKEIPENERIINVYELRKSLEELYKGEGLFKIGQSGDPADLIFLFLNAFHSYFMLAHSLKFSIEKECNPLCISHQYFRFNLIQQNQCMNCNATSDILKYALNFFIYEISLKKIIYKIEELESLDYFQNKLFILFKEITSKTRLDCPNKCKNAEYKNSLVISNILSKLNFKCKDCLTIINYEKMEKHVLSKCDSIDIKYDLNKNKVLSQGISKKFKRSDVIAEKFYEKSPTKIKSNSNQFNFNLIIIIIIVICLGSSEVGKTSLLKR